MRKLCITLALLALLLGAATGTTAADRYAWTESGATRIAFEGSTITVEGGGATADGSTVTITQEGTYVLSGTLDDGQVRVDLGADDDITLVLNGVSLSSSTSAPLYILGADWTTLVLAEGTVNTVTDAASYVYAAGEDEPDAAIFSKTDLRIGGSGTLIVYGNYRNGIGTKDDLVIDGGSIAVTAANDGLRGRDSFTMNGGEVTITAAGDGIQANNDGEDKGWIVVDGGTLTITAAHDGIQAESTLTISAGTLTILSGGGAANAAPRAQEQWGGRGGQTTQVETADEDATSTSYKGLKAGTNLTVTGGDLTIDAADDALHANGDVRIEGGTLSLSTGDDGVHADGDLTITGGSIAVARSYEGLEGATVSISGGDIVVTASDDGINAAGGSDGEAGMWGRDAFRMGGSSNYWIDISGGSITVTAGGDGLDSNGALTISGGTVTIHGPMNSGNGALDADGGIAIHGGTVIAADIGGMSGMPDSSATQAYLAVSYPNGLQAGETVTLTDAGNTVLATYTAAGSYRLVLFSVPELTVGQAYTITASSGITTQVTLTSARMTVSQDGSETSVGGGWGGFGGRGGP